MTDMVKRGVFVCALEQITIYPQKIFMSAKFNQCKLLEATQPLNLFPTDTVLV